MNQTEMNEDNAVINHWHRSGEIIGGTDVKVSFIKNGIETVEPSIRAVDYNGMGDEPYVTISYLLTDSDPMPQHIGSETLRLRTVGAENGPISSCEFQIAQGQEWNKKSWGISIDDIVTEIHIKLFAKESKAWGK